MNKRKRAASDALAFGTRWRRVLIAFAAAPLAAWCAGQTPWSGPRVSRTSTPHTIQSTLAEKIRGSANKPLIESNRYLSRTPNAFQQIIHPDDRRSESVSGLATPRREDPAIPQDRAVELGTGNDADISALKSQWSLPSMPDGDFGPSLRENLARLPSDIPSSITARDPDSTTNSKQSATEALVLPPISSPVVEGDDTDASTRFYTSTPHSINGRFRHPGDVSAEVAISDASEHAPRHDELIASTTLIEAAPSPKRDVSMIPDAITPGPFSGNLDPYRVRADELPDRSRMRDRGAASDETAPLDVQVWWQPSVAQPMGLSSQSLAIDLASVTQIALVSSPYVRGILAEPQIRQNDVVIADAEFDSLAFVEAKFANTNEPVGSELTTGDNSDRFRDETFSSSLGVRKKTRSGGNLELVQRGGFQDNNSTFLIPNPQGTSRLELNFTQPLLRDRGRAVNNTRVLLAQLDLQVAKSEVRDELEDHLLSVTRGYWELYQARADWLQRNRLLEGATRLHDILAARASVDSYQRQILRAEAAVASRRSDLIRAEARVRNAQAQLRVLTGDPRLVQSIQLELTPQDVPLAYPIDISTRQATITALDHRNDIAASIREIQAVSARVGAARNQVLPRLDLILGTYVAGLDGRTDTFGAIGNQFSDGGLSYAAGLLFEIPVANRANRARLARNQWEMKRVLYDFQQATEVAFAEVEIAVRETRTTFDEMVTKKQSIDASNNEVNYLRQRWELLPDPNESPVLLIEDLLDAQERLADEERAFVRAQVAYAMSWVQLRKTTGVLLRMDDQVIGGIP